ncbi:MAG: YraN family protein [Holosporales bacterium]|jgi:putative endonuclease|nr:YraN family protein [Holosporales bacterium]
MYAVLNQEQVRDNSIPFLKSENWSLKTYEKGISAESDAVKVLKDEGYEILGRRVKTEYGEIDILAKKEDFLVAIEVKQRSSIDCARGCISKRQKRRISNALMCIVSDRDELFENYRADVVCFDSVGRLEHIENAFSIEEFDCC